MEEMEETEVKQFIGCDGRTLGLDWYKLYLKIKNLPSRTEEEPSEKVKYQK